jgi:His/Glu/Gln/Arg/opine family amino acid ABC transporter permease subunit
MLSFDSKIFWNALLSPAFAKGALITVALTVASMATASSVGLWVALARQSRRHALKWPAATYIHVARAIPTLLWLLIVWNGLPQVWPIFRNSWFTPFLAAYLALSFNEGAYMAEIIRSGLLSVDEGQRFAARSLGLSPWKVLRRVVLPQAIRIIVPPAGNEFISLLKLTSLASVISLRELLTVTQQTIATNFRFAELYAAAAIYYIVIVSILQLLQSRLEKHLRWSSSNRVQLRLERSMAGPDVVAPQGAVRQ